MEEQAQKKLPPGFEGGPRMRWNWFVWLI